MVQIVLIRPGSTDYDDQGRIQGTLDIPLSEHGNDEVKSLIEQLRGDEISVLYASPCQAAWQTAMQIADSLDIKLKRLDKMQNLDHGLWQGMLVEDVKRKQPKVYRQWQEQPEIICPPEGEMLSDAAQRVQSAMTRILKKHKEGKIGVVLPEPLASVAHALLTRGELGDLWKCTCGCGTRETLAVEPDALVTSSSSAAGKH